MPEYLKSAVVYQIVLHNFTQTGTFKAARAMLDHVRSTGADVVYLTPGGKSPKHGTFAEKMDVIRKYEETAPENSRFFCFLDCMTQCLATGSVGSIASAPSRRGTPRMCWCF